MADRTCPRCDVPLVAKRHESDEVDVHRCERCHGLWIDGMDLMWVFPALSHHGRRIDELLAKGARRETSVTHCARGHANALEFPFFDLWLDVCESCHGLWLDGSEIAFVRRAAQEADGLPDLRKRGGAYRGADAEQERVVCHECGERVHPRRSYLSAEGAICDDCVEIERLSESLEDDRTSSTLTQAARRLLRFFGALLDADGKRLRRGGFTNWGG